MSNLKKQIISTVIATITFYVVGRLGYQHFYEWTILLVKYFSNGTLSFYGKYPFWFIGDPTFGLIFCSIPLTVFLCYRVLSNKFEMAFSWTVTFYISFFILIYLVNCYYESLYLVASNDFHKNGQTLSYNIRDLALNEIISTTFILATILTLITNLLKRLVLTKKRQPTSSSQDDKERRAMARRWE